MIEGALAGAAVVAWVALWIGGRRRTSVVRSRLAPGGRRRGLGVVRGRLASGVRRRAPGTRLPAERQASHPWSNLHVRWRRVRAAEPSAADLAAGCDDLARRLRSGQSLAAAIIAAADRDGAPFLREVARSARLGEPLPDAIERVANASPSADVLLVAQVLGVVAEHGGSQAEAIDRAAATLRERSALDAERHAQAASARLSTRVMTVLPIGFTGFVAATDGDVRAVLLETPVGWTCLAVGLGLNVCGRAWARRAVVA